MYFNALGEKVSRAQWKEMLTAMKNRQEIIAAGLTRRDLLKMGLLTSAGMLVAKSGLSARVPDQCFFNCNQCASPATTPWVQPLPIMPIKQRVTSALNPAPTIAPNNAGGEGRTRAHQSPIGSNSNLPFPPPNIYQVVQKAGQVTMSPQLPVQTIWGFDGISPGPTYVSQCLSTGCSKRSARGHSEGFTLNGFTVKGRWFMPTRGICCSSTRNKNKQIPRFSASARNENMKARLQSPEYAGGSVEKERSLSPCNLVS